MPFTRNTTLLSEHQCGAKYDLGNAQMFVIEGMDRVQKVIEENRERRLTKHKKIPNSTVIEIDNCSPLDILKPQKNLLLVAQEEGIVFADRKGQLKPAYNVQTAVENYFIIHEYVSSGRIDYNTLVPVLGKHREAFGDILEEVTADSGYSSNQLH